MLKTAGALLFLLLSPVLSAEEIPDFIANYRVELNGIQAGELVRSLSTEESGQRLFTSTSQAKGVFALIKPDVITESSRWHWNGEGVQPDRYVYERSGGKKEKWLEMQFDWDNGTASIDDKEQPWQLTLEPGTLDKLVYQISLMHDLDEHSKNISYRIADGGHIKTYNIQVVGTETVTTPMGKIQAVKLIRQRDSDSDRETTLWCAPALNYMPVKLTHKEDGTTFTAMIRRLQGMNSNAAFSR